MKLAKWLIGGSTEKAVADPVMEKFQIVFENAFAIEVAIQAVVATAASWVETGGANWAQDSRN
ncbi:MAG: hypothetical protein CMO44_07975 [Verrucomicrobiales bacterium]|nr:hypothetical protein [Verrucomicrobiales bacterium]